MVQERLSWCGNGLNWQNTSVGRLVSSVPIYGTISWPSALGFVWIHVEKYDFRKNRFNNTLDANTDVFFLQRCTMALNRQRLCCRTGLYLHYLHYLSIYLLIDLLLENIVVMISTQQISYWSYFYCNALLIGFFRRWAVNHHSILIFPQLIQIPIYALRKERWSAEGAL